MVQICPNPSGNQPHAEECSLSVVDVEPIPTLPEDNRHVVSVGTEQRTPLMAQAPV